jgi:hypothetical protein
MTRELEPWGGEVRMPNWVRRVLRRPLLPEDSWEAAHEKRHPPQDLTTPLENVDRAVMGAWSEGHPANRRPHGR